MFSRRRDDRYDEDQYYSRSRGRGRRPAPPPKKRKNWSARITITLLLLLALVILFRWSDLKRGFEGHSGQPAVSTTHHAK